MKSYSLRESLIAFVGAVISAYLVYHFVDVTNSFIREPSFCNISSSFDCDKVAKSKYSVFLGVPVASWGMMYYLGFMLLGLFGAKSRDEDNEVLKRRRAGLRFALASLTLPVTIGLAILSKLYIQTLCLMCMMLYLVNVVIFLLALRDPERAGGEEGSLFSGFKELFLSLNPAASSSVRRWPLFGFVASEVALVLILPTVFYENYLKPEAKEAALRIAVKTAVEQWNSTPAVKLPEFGKNGTDGPDMIRGLDSAPVTILEFSDLECPACHAYAPYVWETMEKYPGKLRLVLKNFPIDKACNRVITEVKHLHACYAASNAICIQKQNADAAWKYVEETFHSDTVDPPTLEKIISGLPVDKNQLKQCVDSGEGLVKVKSDVELALSININSTPSFYVNGRQLAVSPKQFVYAIGLILQQLEDQGKNR